MDDFSKVPASRIEGLDDSIAGGVKDQKSGTGIKYWVGTKEQYDAIIEKDEDMLYIITDD